MSLAIISIEKLGFPWETGDPFLFCAYHADAYPRGNAEMGPEASLAGHSIGQDFNPGQKWRMYHGDKVPGFPSHPHRGFETVTIAAEGLVDHADSLGAAGRFGNGDVQWMTAGKGVQHSEMFPLLSQNEENPLELFQIWLNLPKAKKMAEPHFAMLWQEDIPIVQHTDSQGKRTEIKVIAGRLGDTQALPPAPDSWAADPENEVAIWTIRMEAGAQWRLPAASPGLNRTLYFYRGGTLSLDGTGVKPGHFVRLNSAEELGMVNGAEPAHLLLLQGRPINEPVAQYGPFVMNSEVEIRQAFEEFRQTEFGGWPWPRTDQVHPREKGRFARHADGRLEEK